MPIARVLILLLLASGVRASVISYEGDVFPDSAGWARSDRQYLADRELIDGWFVQRADVAVPGMPPNTPEVDEDDFYRRSTVDFIGTDAFFVEWRMETDGPREGFPNVSPAAIVLGGYSHAFYHFTIARDQARYIDADLEVRLFDIAPDVPHVYRLELNGTTSYRWLIDGQVVFQGIPAGTYPNPDSEIVFGARAAGQPITARWDYIRYGVIPEPATGLMMILAASFVLRSRSRPARRTSRGPIFVRRADKRWTGNRTSRTSPPTWTRSRVLRIRSPYPRVRDAVKNSLARTDAR